MTQPNYMKEGVQRNSDLRPCNQYQYKYCDFMMNISDEGNSDVQRLLHSSEYLFHQYQVEYCDFSLGETVCFDRQVEHCCGS